MDELIQKLAIWALPVIFAVTLHEAAHGYAARHFGDMTAWKLGRVSANPIKHIDPVGTLLVPGALLLLSHGALLFGWARPVPVNFGNLRRPKRDMLWVAAAGPAANLAMLLGWAGLCKLGFMYPQGVYAGAAIAMGMAGISINTSLMLLNLLPIPPLDGGRIVASLLPHRASWRFEQIEPWGLIILVVLLATRVLHAILLPFFELVIRLVAFLFNLPI